MMEFYLVIPLMMRNLREMSKYLKMLHINNTDMVFGQDF